MVQKCSAKIGAPVCVRRCRKQKSEHKSMLTFTCLFHCLLLHYHQLLRIYRSVFGKNFYGVSAGRKLTDI